MPLERTGFCKRMPSLSASTPLSREILHLLKFNIAASAYNSVRIVPMSGVSVFRCALPDTVPVSFRMVKMIEDCHRRFRDDEIVEELIALLETHVRISRELRIFPRQNY